MVEMVKGYFYVYVICIHEREVVVTEGAREAD